MSTSTHAMENQQWPVKTSEFQNHHMDSTRWNDFPFRSDDIIVASWNKSGTTWTQQIVSQLVFLGEEEAPINMTSPWLDFTPIPHEANIGLLEAQKHRRFLKTHSPLENLVFSPKAKYIYVARDGRDAIWSLHNHLHNATPLFYQLINGSPGRVGGALEKPPADPRQYFLDILEDDEQDSVALPIWKTIRGWWAARDLPNLLLVHFNDLKADLSGEIQRIADFLDIEVPEEKLSEISGHCTFEYMKAHATQMSPMQSDIAFEKGADTFINVGSNGRWKDVLTADDVKMYEEKAISELGEECAAWLAEGRKALKQ
jgi:aryl sulfotransferase